MVGGLVAGAQLTCVLVLPAMFAWACFHYTAGGISHAVLNVALTAALAYFGFVPFPAVPHLEWTPAAIFMTIVALLTVQAGLPFLMGGKSMESWYEGRPYTMDQFGDDSEGLRSDVDSGEKPKSYKRARELAWGAHLVGAGSCMAAAVLSGGAQDLSLLCALPCAMNGYVHWLQRDAHAEQKFGAFFCWVFAAAHIGFGIAR